MTSEKKQSINAEELASIILCMQKINSEKYLKGRNGMYLNYFDRKLLRKLEKIQESKRFKRFQEIVIQ